MSKTIFVQADLRDAKLSDIDKNGAYLKYARLGRNDDDDGLLFYLKSFTKSFYCEYS